MTPPTYNTLVFRNYIYNSEDYLNPIYAENSVWCGNGMLLDNFRNVKTFIIEHILPVLNNHLTNETSTCILFTFDLILTFEISYST